MQPTLRQLQHFVAVAELAGFSAAADRLGITQPALSRSIAALEAGFGVRLLDRGRSGVRPTPTGRSLLAEARRLLNEAERLSANLTAMATGVGGSVTFGIGPLVAAIVLPGLLALFARTRPELTVRPLVQARDTLLADVLAGTSEFAMLSRGQEHGDPDVEVERIGGFRLGLFCRSGHPLPAGAPCSRRDIERYPVVTGAATGLPPELSPRIVCEDFHILRHVMFESDAIWLASDRIVADDLASGRARELPIDWHEAFLGQTDIVVAWPANRSVSPAGRAIIDAARTVLA